MRIFLILMLLWTTAFTTNAEEKPKEYEQFLPLPCYPVQPFLKRFRDYYGEELVFMSESVNDLGEALFHQMWMNSETQSWTFMVSNKERELICVIASGKGFADLSEIGI